ncbi:hypothetical protein DNTS_032478 [Danionella cerebrum]|uniref:Rad21/Rec8-like protein N-terminal domain-containing protein n=1 Tax=Danionella cerebrum TaxID=2873325 RepID=A0A553QZR2_9TELE|nr:hypothetical protein DNTS_032478 [Danionella translucida]
MFFYPAVLNHRTGNFATIWLAATKGRKITRRDLLKVNVHSTCNDIINYVLVRVPPPISGVPRPRFSLYLSSQLQYGVVLVFHRQCGFLLEDLQGAIDRLIRLNQATNIDLKEEESRQSHMIPDALALFEENPGAMDPFFGIVDSDLPSPSKLMQEGGRKEGRKGRREEGRKEGRKISKCALITGITASQESITLAERELLHLSAPEFEGLDLPETNMIELLLEQQDHFLDRGDERQVEIERERERTAAEEERERGMLEPREMERDGIEREAVRDLTISGSLDLAQVTGASSKDPVLLPHEELGLPMEMPVLEEREKTPLTVPLPSLPDEEDMDAHRRERARIPGSEASDLPPEILELWKRAAVIKPIAPSVSRDDLELSEPQITQKRRKKSRDGDELHERDEERELSSKEAGIPREMEELELFQQETPAASLVVLETTSEREFSPFETPQMRQSPVPEAQFNLEDIPEERAPELETAMEIDEQFRLQDIPEEPVTFHSLLPPQASRKIVALRFWRLLEETVARHVVVRQHEPYGEIFVMHGGN